jgi:hypothetical protein
MKRAAKTVTGVILMGLLAAAASADCTTPRQIEHAIDVAKSETDPVQAAAIAGPTMTYVAEQIIAGNAAGAYCLSADVDLPEKIASAINMMGLLPSFGGEISALYDQCATVAITKVMVARHSCN